MGFVVVVYKIQGFRLTQIHCILYAHRRLVHLLPSAMFVRVLLLLNLTLRCAQCLRCVGLRPLHTTIVLKISIHKTIISITNNNLKHEPHETLLI